MSDFYQTGCVTTLHRLNPDGLQRLESELRVYSESRPIGVVLPALYSEFETPAMRAIVDELANVDYVQNIVVALGRADIEEYRKATEFFDGFPRPVTFLWIDSPRMQSLFRLLEEHGLSAGEDGKGRSCWLSYGYLLATGKCDVIALHDCDIRNYDRQFLARLCYPVANPNLDFDFCKAFYARVTDRMHGRVTRLFMTPLLRALSGMAPDTPLLHFLDSFRYPLAGEFAMKANLARVNRIPGDWGLEVGVLSEVFRNCSSTRTCQVDLADNYDHKHQRLSPDNPASGLRRMTVDIAKTLFRTLAGEGVCFGREHFRALEVRYTRLAEDTMNRYYADALLNGLIYDRHCEEQAVRTFALSLRQASAEFLEDPLGLPLIPNWNRVIAAIPDFFDLLLKAVDEDCSVGRLPVAA
jgi:glucosyl-3-phosphoglycerate synthase